MYAQESIPNSQPAFVKMTYVPPSQGKVAVAIYNLFDQDNLGRRNKDNDKIYFCSEGNSDLPCSKAEENTILFDNAASTIMVATPLSKLVPLDKLPIEVSYIIHKTGIYCVIEKVIAQINEFADVEANIEYQNAYGSLPAVDYPKLPFYGVTCSFYVLIFSLWAYRCHKYWQDILPIQKYIGGVVFFLVVETAFNYSYMRNWNTTGTPSWLLLCITAILNAARNSISFFILLIVCMGFGVVKPSLGDTMRKCILLALTHFVFGAIYTGFSLKKKNIKSRPSLLILVVAIPLAITMTTFYVWTLSSLIKTTRHLEQRRQTVKLIMYKRIWALLVFGALNVVAFFISNSWWLANRESAKFLARWWTWRWFILDCWPNLLYTVFVTVVCILWRPTRNNARYGLEQLATDPLEAEFELDMPDIYDDSDFETPNTKHQPLHDIDNNNNGHDVFRVNIDGESDYEDLHDTRASRSPHRQTTSTARSRSRSRSPVRNSSRGASISPQATRSQLDNSDDNDDNDTDNPMRA